MDINDIEKIKRGPGGVCSGLFTPITGGLNPCRVTLSPLCG